MSDELRTPHDYHRWAASLKDGTLLAETAKGVCIVRGKDPYRYIWSSGGHLQYWQAVALEAVLMAAIAKEPLLNPSAE